MRAIHMTVRGRVQGVGFRQNTARKARKLGVLGWVRNRQDGTVEAFAQGETDAIQQLIEWAHRGPPSARVDAVAVEEAQPDPAHTMFEVRETL